MPPQVGRAGDGSQPVVTNAGSEEIQEGKSTEVPKEVSQNEVAEPYRASAKEASNRKAELGAGGASQKSTLNKQLDEKKGAPKKTQTPPNQNVIRGTSGNDNVHISKAPGMLGVLGLYEVNVNGAIKYMTKEQLEKSKFELGAGKR